MNGINIFLIGLIIVLILVILFTGDGKKSEKGNVRDAQKNQVIMLAELVEIDNQQKQNQNDPPNFFLDPSPQENEIIVAF